MEPSDTLFKAGAIMVAPDGDLVSDWDQDRKSLLAARAEHTAYVLFDANIASAFTQWPHYISTAPGVAYAYLADYRSNRPDLFHTDDSLAGLAAKAGMDPAKLTAAVETANRRRGGAGGPSALQAGPWVLLGPAKLFVTFTDGGLAVDESLRVINRQGQAIAGLYAAGSTGQGGLVLEGHGHHLGWAFTSGRLAGRNAAFESLTPEI
jgi:succinate dehydrogenase/fumarate reductase flavoprotein subunit